MAPIRRYLRITKFSVLECRIYLDNPALAESWLLNPRNPILPRVIESVRPLVIPKLHEENERARKGGKKKSVKDIVIKDDFEVSIFLTETSTRHSLLTKQKHFRDKGKTDLKSNSDKLMGATNDAPINVEDMPEIRREESDDSMTDLQDIPGADDDDEDGLFVPEGEHQKRRRSSSDAIPSSSPGFDPLPKRRKELVEDVLETSDDKKKMAMDTTYDGFAIYGRVLCLVVKRKDNNRKKGARLAAAPQATGMMEDWIASTQIPPQEDGS